MENKVLDSWNVNAAEWINLLGRDGIPSRKITNLAIIDTVLDNAQGSILDIGCGEGWLVRALASYGKEVSGIDGTQILIDRAKEQSKHEYSHVTYEQLIEDSFSLGVQLDTIVFNYSLYGEDLVQDLLTALSNRQEKGARLIIQTVHPTFLIKDRGAYSSRWIENAWNGLDGNFSSPHQWYCRTMADWIQVLNSSGYHLIAIKEPTSKEGHAISLIIVGQKM